MAKIIIALCVIPQNNREGTRAEGEEHEKQEIDTVDTVYCVRTGQTQ